MIWDDLATHAWLVQDDFISKADCQELAHYLDEQASQFSPALVGRGPQKLRRTEVRGDTILWLEENNENPACRRTRATLEVLHHDLNKNLFLGLRRFECHFAVYPQGAGYELHLDQLQGQKGRKITFVLYLNENWRAEDGGELEMHLGTGPQKILPLAGRLVLFQSETVLHRVLPSNQKRKSLTGWFRDDDMPW